MTTPRVSVIMPVYNGERWLMEAIGSVLGQTADDLELIVTDDASTDGSKDVLASIRDRRIRVVSLQHSVGAGAARNAGLEFARGLYVAALDADDQMLPDKLELQIQHICDTGADVSIAAYTVVDARGRPKVDVPVLARHLDILREMRSRNAIAHGSVLMRRAALVQVGGWPSGAAEDYMLWYRLECNYSSFAGLNRSVFRYRVHDQSTTSTKSNKQVSSASDIKRLFWARGLPWCSSATYSEEQERLLDGSSIDIQAAQLLAYDQWRLFLGAVRRGKWQTAVRQFGLCAVSGVWNPDAPRWLDMTSAL